MSEYVVYECNPTNCFEFLSDKLFETDNLDAAHIYAYERNQGDGKAYVIWQARLNASRGGYGYENINESSVETVVGPKPELNEKTLRDMMISLAESLGHEPIDLDLASEGVRNLEPSVFYYNLVSPVNTACREVISENLKANPQAYFMFEQFYFVESHIENMIIRLEGTRVCCSDKSSTVIEAILQYLVEDKPIVFNYDAEYTYHLPKKYFVAQEPILEFYFALQELYYGKPVKYLDCLSKMMRNDEPI